MSSVDRALTIVEYLATSPSSGVALSQIAGDLNINKATAHNTLSTLRARHWVEQDAANSYYRLGEGIRPIANYRTSNQRIIDMLHPALTAISQQFNELVHLGTLVGKEVIYLDKIEPDRPIRVVSRIGKTASAVRTGLGRAIIAAQPNRLEALKWFMTEPKLLELSAKTTQEISESVHANFARFDSLGWTQEVEENEPGIACVAVPITIDGRTNVAISITTPIERSPESRRPLYAHGIAAEIAQLPPMLRVSTPPQLSTAPTPEA